MTDKNFIPKELHVKFTALAAKEVTDMKKLRRPRQSVFFFRRAMQPQLCSYSCLNDLSVYSLLFLDNNLYLIGVGGMPYKTL